MDLSGEFDSIQRGVSDALVATIRSTSRIAAEDIGFHRTSDPAVARSVQKNGSRLLSLAEELLNQSSRLESRARIRLRSIESTTANWTKIVDELDNLLERTDSTLDEYSGYFRKRKDGSRDSSPAPKRPKFLPREFRTQVIAKPQLSFLHKPFNHETLPFKPLLQTKPHALVKLSESVHVTSDGRFSHPYQREIDDYDYPSHVKQVAVPIQPQPYESTQAIFVDSIEAAHTMLDELRGVKEIAIDLEHHDTHSYIGMVSLMQISTRNKDWIIDTLKPWRRELEMLNEVFADPSIVKVLHGAQMDAIWLQRDLGLYLVGLFDTYHASRALGYAGHSLAYLLKKFAAFDAQKQYQTADWRIRPLPSELFDYARSDTHFLLNIYDHMRNELLQNSSNKQGNKMQDVLNASKEYTLQRYEHPAYCTLPVRSHNGWFGQLLRMTSDLTDTQLVAFRKLHEWRDKVGRDEDESTNYILPNFALLNVARSLPTTVADLFNVLGTPSHIARARANELIAIISDSLNDSSTASNIKRHLVAFHHTQMVSQTQDNEPESGASTKTSQSIRRSSEHLRALSSQFWGSATEPEGSNIVFAPPHPFSLIFFGSSNHNQILPYPEDSTQLDLSQKHDTGDHGSRATKIFSKNQEQPADSSAHDMPNSSQDSYKPKMRFTREPKKPHDINENEIPFDYDNEPSIIQSEDAKDLRRKKSRVQESFNPFAKAADAQGGIGRPQRSRLGRTATFKGTTLQ